MEKIRIAVLIPCYNEALTIKKVIFDFQQILPTADIYVYDNNSTDNTGMLATEAGAIVKHEYRQGKGWVVRSMFSQIDADVYIITDGDDTYPSQEAYNLIKPIVEQGADMVVGDRLSNGVYAGENKRLFHNLGNKLVCKSINTIFHADISDVMTGYRAFSRKFVKNFPITSAGFEIETEMTLHALDKRFAIVQIPIAYKDRPEGSLSKLNTIPDGIKVIQTIGTVFKNFRPMSFFGFFCVMCLLLAFAFGTPVIVEFIKIQYITHVPLAILASSLVIISLLSLVCGLILDTLVSADKRNYELQLIRYEEIMNIMRKNSGFY